MLKTIEELMAIKQKTLEKMTVREDQSGFTRVVVGMATCGIAAGARPVMNAFVDEIEKRHLQNVTVSQTGCIGMCQFEPIVEVFEPGKEKVTYVLMNEEKARKVVVDHLVNGVPVKEYTVGAATK
ncbi:MAG TPA: (2Fe-2S) ferredoxin domain-containing protein [Candidatus Onthovicinus excrementipullorum]|nr:(2Fe-2S) ferredoxin domain-containing protein [Candidatus Onthovicinus excrementipullorum]